MFKNRSVQPPYTTKLSESSNFAEHYKIPILADANVSPHVSVSYVPILLVSLNILALVKYHMDISPTTQHPVLWPIVLTQSTNIYDQM